MSTTSDALMQPHTRYIARVRLPFGEQTILPGEEVPYEEGRDYALMLKRRQIEELRVGGGDGPVIVLVPADAIAPGWVHLPSVDAEELQELAQRYGHVLAIVGELETEDGALAELQPNTGEELLVLHEDLALLREKLIAQEANALAVTQDRDRIAGELRSLQEEFRSRALADAAAHDVRHTPPASAPTESSVEIPATLPTTRAELLDLAGRLKLDVTGTGAKGFIKEGDLVSAIEAERARRAAPAA